MLWILIPATAAMILAGPALLLVYGSKFPQGSAWLAIVAIACATNAFVNLGETVIMVQRPALNLMNSLITSVTGTAITFWLITEIGVMGAALGILATYGVQGLVRTIILRRVFHWPSPWKDIREVIGVAFAAIVPALAVRLLEEACVAGGRPKATFSKAALALVGALTWPGNLAELRSVIQRIAADARGDVIQIEQLLPAMPLSRAAARFVPAGNLREARLRFERDYISSVLQHHEWRMADAARTLGIQRPNLYRKARQLGIPLTRSSE